MFKLHARNFIIICLVSLIPTFLIWLPFFLRLPSFWNISLPQQGMATIIANFDGPYYIAIAKTFYNPQELSLFQFPLPSNYYAAHFPGFPLLIKTFSFLGYPWAMMIVTLLSSIAALWFFYLLLGQISLKKHALWLTFLFAVFPARWLIVRSIGSPEPLFIASILASYYFLLRGNFLTVGVMGSIAMLTKSPGILLFAALVIAMLIPKLQELMIHPISAIRKVLSQFLPILLIPLTTLGIFLWYGRTYGDFLAYFHSGDNIHLLFPPFQVFNAAQAWVGTFWLEEIIWLYIFGALGVIYLIKQKYYPLAWFTGIFFLSTLFVSHRDIARYSLPLVPFLLIAFQQILVQPIFRWILAFLIIPIYLFSLNFIIHNVTPIADWGPLL